MARIYGAQQDPEDEDLREIIEGYEPGGGSRQAQDEAERERRQRKPVGGMTPDYRVRVPRRSISPFDPSAGRATHGGQAGTTNIGPRYFDDDVFKPAGSGADAIKAKQQALLIAGYLSPDTEFVYGRWDPPTMDAYATLLAEANASGLSAEAQLRASAEGVPIGGGGGGGGGGGAGANGHWEIDPATGEPVWVEEPFVPPALRVRTTHKDDLRTVFRAAVRDKLGAGWTDAQVDELVDAYNWKEIQLQTEAYDQEVDRMRQEFEFEGGGPEPSAGVISEVNAPSPENFLDTELRKRDPSGYAAGQIGEEFAPAFFDALGGYV